MFDILNGPGLSVGRNRKGLSQVTRQRSSSSKGCSQFKKSASA